MKLDEANLKFELDFKTPELSQVELPIEVRKTDLELIGRPLSSETISVEPGTYFISAELPSGQKITTIEEISAGENSIKLTPNPNDVSPHESHERTHYLRTDFNAVLNVDLDLADPTNMGRARILVGNPFFGQVDDFAFPPAPHKLFDESNQLWQIRIPTGYEISESRFLIAQFIQPLQPPVNLALPRGPANGCELVVTRTTTGGYNVSVQLESLEADLLLRYREESLYDQLSALGRSTKIDPENLLQQKEQDPIAAAVGAYNILKVGELERLHNWTENLKNWFSWLPDGAAIRGEHHARLGEHQKALEAFMLLESRGLPFFCDGFSYAMDRLRLYKSNWRETFDPNDPHSRGQAVSLLDRLERFEPFVDFSKAVMTLTGIDPARPDASPLESIPAGMSFDFEF